MKNRKFWTYVIAVASILTLEFFNKGGSSQIVALATALFAANVSQKFSKYPNIESNEDMKSANS